MDIIEAILLGLVQGATEFLPVSSSGHLILIPSLLNLSEPDLNLIAIAHQGTLLAVLVYFRRELIAIIKGVLASLRDKQLLGTVESRLGWFILLGTIPAIIAGLTFADFIDETLSDPVPASIMLVLTGIILIIGERLMRGIKDLAKMTWLDALIIGVAQLFALVPGISRSGITMSTGLGRGLDRPSAARYSFLLGIPAIAGAGLIAALDLAGSPDLAEQIPELLITFLTAFIVGYACIYWLLNWVRQHSFYIFAFYCIGFGIFNLVMASF